MNFYLVSNVQFYRAPDVRSFIDTLPLCEEEVIGLPPSKASP